MRLICPNCSTQYDVDAAAIPDGGREVQCGVCDTVWFQPDARGPQSTWPAGDAAPPEEESIVDEPDLDDIAPAGPAPEIAAETVAAPVPDPAPPAIPATAAAAVAATTAGTAYADGSQGTEAIAEVAASQVAISVDEETGGEVAAKAPDSSASTDGDTSGPVDLPPELSDDPTQIEVPDAASTVEALRAAIVTEESLGAAAEASAPIAEPSPADPQIAEIDSDALASAFSGEDDDDALGKISAPREGMVWTDEGELVEAESFAGQQTLAAEAVTEAPEPPEIKEPVEDVAVKADEVVDVANEADALSSVDFAGMPEPRADLEEAAIDDALANLPDATIGRFEGAEIEDVSQASDTIKESALSEIAASAPAEAAEADMASAAKAADQVIEDTTAPAQKVPAVEAITESVKAVVPEVDLPREPEPVRDMMPEPEPAPQQSAAPAPMPKHEPIVEIAPADENAANGGGDMVDFGALSALPFVAGISAKGRSPERRAPQMPQESVQPAPAPTPQPSLPTGTDVIAKATEAARRDPTDRQLNREAEEAILAQMMGEGRAEPGVDKFAADLRKVGIVSETEGHEDLAQSVQNAVKEFDGNGSAANGSDGQGLTLAERLKERVRAAALAEEDARRQTFSDDDTPLGATPAAVAAASSTAVDTMPDTARTLSSSLSPRSGDDPGTPRAGSEAKKKKSRFPAGFFSALMVFGLLAILYVYHAPIGNSVPAVKSPLMAYAGKVDQMRGGLQNALGVDPR